MLFDLYNEVAYRVGDTGAFVAMLAGAYGACFALALACANLTSGGCTC